MGEKLAARRPSERQQGWCGGYTESRALARPGRTHAGELVSKQQMASHPHYPSTPLASCAAGSAWAHRNTT